MRVQSIVRRGAFALALMAMNCGGSSSPGPSPSPNPGPSPSPPANQAGQVSIVGERGNQSFTPNPSSPGSNGMVTWANADTVVHRIVANDNSFDTGDLAPGASSAAIAVAAAGTNFHCSIHPSMVGAVASSGGTAPPCTGIYC